MVRRLRLAWAALGLLALRSCAWLAPKADAPTPARRQVLLASVAALRPEAARADSNEDLIGAIKKDRELLDRVPGLLKEQKWDSVRSVLKVPPVSLLWNLGLDKNPLKKLGDNLGDVQVLEAMDDISSALQTADEIAYSNVYVYGQPGEGKVKIEEPIIFVKTAMSKLDEVLQLVS
mmetsp:Transcript_105782/g.252319  ORF Transcript_105782/g.252319 Transcript_105782/m.252319 type:complete len:176 (+) Transcript_105782:72-599(+)